SATNLALWRPLESGDRTFDEGDGGVVAGGDAECLFESQHLREACHDEQSDDRWQLVCGDAVGGKGGSERFELSSSEAFGMVSDLGADRFAMVCHGNELDREGGPAWVGVELPERP